MLPKADVLSRLVGHVYDAASDPTFWQVFLKDLAEVANGSSAVLLVHEKMGQGLMTCHVGFDPPQLELYNSHYNQQDEWALKAWPIVSSHPFVVSEMLVPTNDLVRTNFYNDWLRPCDIGHAVLGVFEHEGSRVSNVTICRPLQHESFAADDLELLKFLAPHLRRAFRLHFELLHLKQGNETFEASLNALTAGVFFLDENRRVHFMNRAASKLINSKAGLIVTGQRLCAELVTENTRLDHLVRQAALTSVRDGLNPGGAILVSRADKPPLQVTVSPVHHLPSHFQNTVSVIVFVSDPMVRVHSCGELLSAFFGLTPAECRIAILLGYGNSLPEIAAMLEVSVNTLKTQVSSIYNKTGTARQSQLVGVITRMPGWVQTSY